MIIFLNIESFKTFLKPVGGSDTEIVNTIWNNLIRKWTFPMDAGNILFDDDAGLGPNEDQGEWTFEFGRASNRERGISRIVLPKPVMLTGTATNILAYTLDFKINPTTGGGSVAVANPDVINDGLNNIEKLTSEDGLEWTVAKDDGVVLDLNGVDLKPNSIFLPAPQTFINVTGEDVFPAPFLLFGRSSIA